MAIVGYVRDTVVTYLRQDVGPGVAEFGPFLLLLPCLGILALTCVWADHKVKHFALFCPKCEADFSQSTPRVLATCCCSVCDEQIVEGRTHSVAVFRRYSEMRARRFLVYWFWMWPALGSLCLGTYWFDPTAMSNCEQCLMIPALIGTSAAGWTICRTMDSRYVVQFVVSAILLCVGVAAYW